MGREYKMLMGKDQADMFDAMLKNNFNPTEESKKELERLQEENTVRLNDWQFKAEREFIKEHGQLMLDLVKSISKEYFLVAKSKPFYLSWTIKTDTENDDYYSVRFWKGKFDYILEECGGYAGTKVLEEDLSHVRIMELINDTK